MRIVGLHRHLVEQKREYTLSKELLIAGYDTLGIM